MRFVALFKKELRETAPWTILAAVVMLLICGGLVSFWMKYTGGEPPYWRVEPGETVSLYDLLRRSELADCGPVILLTTAGLGVILAARQFMVPISLKTWAFTIHRSTSPISILLAKVFMIAEAGCPVFNSWAIAWK